MAGLDNPPKQQKLIKIANCFHVLILISFTAPMYGLISIVLEHEKNAYK